MNTKISINSNYIIGEDQGKPYIIVQMFINGNHKKILDSKYCDCNSINNKIMSILNRNISNITFNSDQDILKFNIDNNSTVYVNDYSKINNDSQLKIIKDKIHNIQMLQKFNKKFTLVKKSGKKILKGKIFNFFIASSLSLGIIGTPVASAYKDESNFINSKYNILDNLIQSASISDKLSEMLKKSINNKDLYIQEIASMYYIDYETVLKIYSENYDTIINSSNPKKELIILVKNYFYSDTTIDKTPIISHMSAGEKENCIIDIARKIYNVEDEETLKILLAIHRFETYYGTSNRCINDNNLGGLRESGEFLKFKTFEIGAECFVRNTLRIKNQCLNNYDYDLSLIGNMQKIYCEDNIEWAYEIEKFKKEVEEDNILKKYIDNDKSKILVYK